MPSTNRPAAEPIERPVVAWSLPLTQIDFSIHEWHLPLSFYGTAAWHIRWIPFEVCKGRWHPTT